MNLPIRSRITLASKVEIRLIIFRSHVGARGSGFVSATGAPHFYRYFAESTHVSPDVRDDKRSSNI